MEEKINKKIIDNQRKLEQWHKSINKYNVYCSQEAKKLMRCYTNEMDEDKKIKIRNDIVLGTLEYVYQFLKQSIFINIICNWFDMDDVINATVEAWIKSITNESKRIYLASYVIDSKYTLYSQKFMNYILANLCGEDTFYFSRSGLSQLQDLINWYYIYLKVKQNNHNLSFEDFKNIIGNKNEDLLDDSKLLKIYNFFGYLEHVLKIKEDKITIEVIDSLKFLIGNYFNMHLDDFHKETFNENEILNRLLAQEIFKNITNNGDGIKTLERRQILYKMLYECKTQREIGIEMQVSHSRIYQVENNCLNKARVKYKSCQKYID